MQRQGKVQEAMKRKALQHQKHRQATEKARQATEKAGKAAKKQAKSRKKQAKPQKRRQKAAKAGKKKTLKNPQNGYRASGRKKIFYVKKIIEFSFLKK